jgi:acid stress-induced BolA-like protein IbaG/YrbA
MSKSKIEEILTRRLNLKDPVFYLRREGNHVFGSVISVSFRKKRDLKRQKMIHEALEAELGETPARRIGMLLAYTPEEWDWDLDSKPSAKKAPQRVTS